MQSYLLKYLDKHNKIFKNTKAQILDGVTADPSEHYNCSLFAVPNN